MCDINRFYICEFCGNVIGMIHDAGVPVMCCGEEMTKLGPGTTDGSQEKHAPVVCVEDNIVHVSVGSVHHPMEEEHSIQWVYLQTDNPNEHKELMFGIYSRPGAVLITVDDTGSGISQENLENIFGKGFSTKGEGRGTGLYQIKTMVESFGGTISVESQEGVGSSFTVSFAKE